MTRLFAFLFSFALFAHEYAGHELYRDFTHPDKRMEIVRQFLPEDPFVFEAGAFDGTDSQRLARAWPQGTIVSFEPNPTRFAQVLAKQLPNMQSYNLAVNTTNGESDFFLCWGTYGKDPIFEGASSLLPASESMKIHYMGPTIKVPCVRLDDWCEANNIHHFDFMWLDLEGFELQLLKSSPHILSTVKVIYTETNLYPFRENTTQYSELKSFLESQGFQLIAHWYTEGLQGDAIFVRRELL